MTSAEGAGAVGEGKQRHNFVLHWLNNKEMQFTMEAEKIMDDLFKVNAHDLSTVVSRDNNVSFSHYSLQLTRTAQHSKPSCPTLCQAGTTTTGTASPPPPTATTPPTARQ